MITYRTGNDLDLDQFIEVYVDSTLGERRPVEDLERMKTMLGEADLVISAWDGDRMVGVCRSVTDWVYCTYLSDLAVRASYQGQGIGREMGEANPRSRAASHGDTLGSSAGGRLLPQGRDGATPVGMDASAAKGTGLAQQPGDDEGSHDVGVTEVLVIGAFDDLGEDI